MRVRSLGELKRIASFHCMRASAPIRQHMVAGNCCMSFNYSARPYSRLPMQMISDWRRRTGLLLHPAYPGCQSRCISKRPWGPRAHRAQRRPRHSEHGMPRLFSTFHRLADIDIKGGDLGLPPVQLLVESHGVTVAGSSTAASGTTFTIQSRANCQACASGP